MPVRIDPWLAGLRTRGAQQSKDSCKIRLPIKDPIKSAQECWAASLMRVTRPRPHWTFDVMSLEVSFTPTGSQLKTQCNYARSDLLAGM